MSKPSTTRRKRRAVTDKGHYGWLSRATRALVASSTICAIVGVGLLAVPGSQAATTKQGTPTATAAVSCETNVYNKGIPGVVINDTNVSLKRIFVEHGPSTGFFNPEPAAEVAAKSVSSPWCVGTHFGVEAMKVEYELPNHEKMYFQAYYPVFGVGGLQASCSSTAAPGFRATYGCGADKVTPKFSCNPYVCVGPLHNESALHGVDVAFTVFPLGAK